MIHVLNEPLPESRGRSPGKRRPPRNSKSRTRLANQFSIPPEPVKLPPLKDNRRRSEAENPTAVSSSPKVQASRVVLPDIGSSGEQAACHSELRHRDGEATRVPSEGRVDSGYASEIIHQHHPLELDERPTTGNQSDVVAAADSELTAAAPATEESDVKTPPPQTPALIELLSVGEAVSTLSHGSMEGGALVVGAPEVPEYPNEMLLQELDACLRCNTAKIKQMAVEKCGRLARHYFSVLMSTGVIQLMLDQLDNEKPNSVMSQTVVSSIAEMSVVVDARRLVAPHANKIVQMLTDGEKNGHERTCLAIMNLVTDESCRDFMLRANVVPTLLKVIRDEGLREEADLTARTLTYAAGALANLVNNSSPAALQEIYAAEGGVDTLVRVLALGKDNIAMQRIALVVGRLKAEIPGAADTVHALAQELCSPEHSNTQIRKKKVHPWEAGKEAYHPCNVLMSEHVDTSAIS